MRKRFGQVNGFLLWHHTIKVFHIGAILFFQDFLYFHFLNKQHDLETCSSLFSQFTDYEWLCSGKMQHSLWVAELVNSSVEMKSSIGSDVVPDEVCPEHLSFRRIWQWKGAQAAASKVTIFESYPFLC